MRRNSLEQFVFNDFENEYDKLTRRRVASCFISTHCVLKTSTSNNSNKLIISTYCSNEYYNDSSRLLCLEYVLECNNERPHM